jgi:transglutaminase-like putative cysteine protease
MTGSRQVFGLVVVALALSGCSTVFDRFEPGGLRALDLGALPPIDDSPARRLLDEYILRFGVDVDSGEVIAHEWRHRQTRIHNSQGQDYRQAALYWDRTFSRVEGFRAQTIAPTGEVTVVDEDDLVDVPDLGTYYLYSDNRRSYLPVPEQPKGAVVDVVSLLRQTSPTLFAFSHIFGDGIDVDVSRFVVDVPAGFDVDFIAEAGGVPTAWAPTETTTSTGRRLVWERKKLARLELGDAAPDLRDVAERVSVRLRRATDGAGRVVEGPADAPSLSREMARMMAASVTVTPKIEAIVKEVLGENPKAVPQRERAAKLYAWTRDSIRYCSIQIGLGGWVPHEAKATEELRYGDCKDKANLLRTLLQAVDVKSRIVTIRSGRSASPFRLPVVAGNFNHAILVVDLDDGSVFVDPTTRTVAFADLPPNDEARVCLPADERGSELLQTPTSTLERDRRRSVVKLSVDASGKAVGDVEAVYEGSFADGMRDMLLETPEEEQKKAIARSLRGDSLKISDAKFEHAAPPVEVTPLTLRATAKQDLAANGSLAGLLNASALLATAMPDLPLSRPHLDVVFGRRAHEHDEFRVRLPAGASVSQHPPAASGESPWLRWQLEWSVDGDTLVLRRTIETLQERVPAADVATLRAQLSAYFRAMEARVILQSPPKQKT